MQTNELIGALFLHAPLHPRDASASTTFMVDRPTGKLPTHLSASDQASEKHWAEVISQVRNSLPGVEDREEVNETLTQHPTDLASLFPLAMTAMHPCSANISLIEFYFGHCFGAIPGSAQRSMLALCSMG